MLASKCKSCTLDYKSSVDLNCLGWFEVDLQGVLIDISDVTLRLLHQKRSRILNRPIYETITDSEALNYIKPTLFNNLEDITLTILLSEKMRMQVKTDWMVSDESNDRNRIFVIIKSDIKDVCDIQSSRSICREKQVNLSLKIDNQGVISRIDSHLSFKKKPKFLSEFLDDELHDCVVDQISIVRKLGGKLSMEQEADIFNLRSTFKFNFNRENDGDVRVEIKEVDHIYSEPEMDKLINEARITQIRILRIDKSKDFDQILDSIFNELCSLRYIIDEYETLLIYSDMQEKRYIRRNGTESNLSNEVEFNLNNVLEEITTDRENATIRNSILELISRGFICMPLYVQGNKRGVISFRPNLSKLDSLRLSILKMITECCSQLLTAYEIRLKHVRSEQFLAKLVENSEEITIIADDHGYIKYITPAVQRILGYSVQDVLMTSVFNFIDSEDLESALIGFKERIVSGGHGKEEIYRIRCFNDEVRHLKTITTNCLEDEAIQGIIINAYDVSDLIIQTRNNSIMAMITEQEERRRIARDLHDGLGQSIVAANLFYRSLETKIRPNVDEAVMDIYNTGKSLFNSLAVQTREISHNLIPSPLMEFGLIVSIQEILELYSRTNEAIKISLDVERFNESSMSKDIQLAVFRMIQELINNAIKHANCENIHIVMSEVRGTFLISVEDDGIGLQEDVITKVQKSKGLGMSSITHRLNVLGGELTINPSKNEGVEFIIRLPKY